MSESIKKRIKTLNIWGYHIDIKYNERFDSITIIWGNSSNNTLFCENKDAGINHIYSMVRAHVWNIVSKI